MLCAEPVLDIKLHGTAIACRVDPIYLIQVIDDFEVLDHISSVRSLSKITQIQYEVVAIIVVVAWLSMLSLQILCEDAQ